MYLPLAPLATAVVLGGYVAIRRLASGTALTPPATRLFGVCIVVGAVTVLAVRTYTRNEDYRTKVRIWEDTVAKAPDNVRAHENLAAALVSEGKVAEAIPCRQRATELWRRMLGEKHFGYAASLNNLAYLYQCNGDHSRAESLYSHAKEIAEEALGEKHADYAKCLGNLASLYVSMGDYTRAAPLCRQTLEITPNDYQAHYLLGVTLHQQGKDQEALEHWREVLRLQPNQVVILLQSAWVLATSPDSSVRNGAEAIALAERAVQLPVVRTPKLLDTLAAAYAEAGRFSEAAETAQQALGIASAESNKPLADALRDRVRLYQAGCAFRESRK